MGQYYKICNLDKREYLYSHTFGDGLKLIEFGNSAGGMLLGLTVLLADGNGRGGGDIRVESDLVGRWAGDRIVIGGDYADPGRFVEPAGDTPVEKKANAVVEGLADQDGPLNLYEHVERHFNDISQQVVDVLIDAGEGRWSHWDFVESLRDRQQRSERGLRPDVGILAPRVDISQKSKPTISLETAQSALNEAAGYGPKYFELARGWLLAEKLNSGVAPIVKSAKFVDGDGRFERKAEFPPPRKQKNESGRKTA